MPIDWTDDSDRALAAYRGEAPADVPDEDEDDDPQLASLMEDCDGGVQTTESQGRTGRD